MDMFMCAILFRGIHWMHHAEIWCVVRPINYAFCTGYKWRASTSAQVQPNILLSTSRFCSLIAQKASYWCQPKSVTSDDLQKVNV